MSKEIVYAFDIGGTKSSIALFDGERFLHYSLSTPNTGNFEKDFEYFSNWKKTLLFSEQGSVFVSSAPLCDTGIVKKWANRPYWVGHDLRKALVNLFECSFIEIKDDCNFAAYGAHRVKSDGKSSIYINIGTGVGMGIILSDTIYNGENGYAGELGHITIDPSSKKICSCGKFGCLQSYVSGKRFQSFIQSMEQNSIFSLENSSFQKILVKASSLIGVVASNIITLLDINDIFLGGGLFKNHLFLLNTCETVLDQEKKFLNRSLNIYNCAFNNWSLIGAALYGMDNKNVTSLNKENLTKIFGNDIKKWN